MKTSVAQATDAGNKAVLYIAPPHAHTYEITRHGKSVLQAPHGKSVLRSPAKNVSWTYQQTRERCGRY